MVFETSEKRRKVMVVLSRGEWEVRSILLSMAPGRTSLTAV